MCPPLTGTLENICLMKKNGTIFKKYIKYWKYVIYVINIIYVIIIYVIIKILFKNLIF
jgi:hypothetical protein